MVQVPEHQSKMTPTFVTMRSMLGSQRRTAVRGVVRKLSSSSGPTKGIVADLH